MASRLQGWLLSTDYSSSPLYLQFHLPSQCSNCPASLSVHTCTLSWLLLQAGHMAGEPRWRQTHPYSPPLWHGAGQVYGYFLPPALCRTESRLASVCLLPARAIQQISDLWASLSASDSQQWQRAGLKMSYSNYSVLHEGRQGSVCSVPASSL